MRVAVGVELEPDVLADLRAQFPAVEFVDAQGYDGLLAAIGDCEIVFGGHVKAPHVNAAPQLRWVQTYSAGVNHFPFNEMRERDIHLTNASGAHAIPIAENILAMMLAFAIRLPDFVRAQEQRQWRAREIAPSKFELDGATILIAGLGGIGASLAVKAKGIGMRVVGLRNRDLPPPPGVDRILLRDQLHEGLADADHVALCLPLTDDTTSFLGPRELRAMKASAYVYNVGRGKSIDRQALLDALSEGWIAGAGLDVTDPEPLPAEDPLWTFPNVILSQHTSGSGAALDRRVTDIFADNLRRYLRGAPLRNQIDFDCGY